ncbi:MAG: 3'-5' exonuclease [Nitrospirae bacterium]|nr:3'-5' exonuclease [Nitrospirota bacterium]
MYLFFDTETTGLPRNYRAPLSDVRNWPRMVQIAWLLYDEEGNQISGRDYIIKPDGFVIPKEASNIHHITTEKARQEGHDLAPVLEEFYELVQSAEYLVAHNMDFDEKIIGAEFLRNNMPNILDGKKKICTMKSFVTFCALPRVNYRGYKWPKLDELYRLLFQESVAGAHNAVADTLATARCFWELKKRGIYIGNSR